MAKPAALPEWATDAGADVVEPSTGKKEIGWEAEERPPAQFLNWWQELVYDWLSYLNDGDFEGASTFDDTLEVTGVLTTLSTIAANAGLTASANQDITVSGTGKFKHGDVQLPIPYHAFTSFFDTANNEPGVIISTSGGGAKRNPAVDSAGDQEARLVVNLPVGARVRQVITYWDRGGSSGEGTMLVGTTDITDGSISGTQYDTATGTGAASATTGAVGDIAITPSATEAFLIRVVFGNLGGDDGELEGALVTYDVP